MLGRTRMTETDQPLSRALNLMQTALSLIDSAEAAHDVAAHLDLAICRLHDIIQVVEEGTPTGSDRNNP